MNSDQTIGNDAINTAIQAIAQQIQEANSDEFVIVGIANGGVDFAEKLQPALSTLCKAEIPMGKVNIMFHRDDIGHNPIPNPKQTTELPCDIEGKKIILVDDVIFTGRSARAALNEIFDLGRPKSVELAVLFDRGNRRLPIQPDYIGFTQETDFNQRVVVKLHPDNSNEDSITITNT